MADTLGTNPIVVDLNDSTDRIIKLGDVPITSIVLSGNATGACEFSITDTDASGDEHFAFLLNTPAIVQKEIPIYSIYRSPFMNVTTEGWAANSNMYIYVG